MGISLILATIGRTDELVRFFESINECQCGSIQLIVVDQNGDDRLLAPVGFAKALGLNVLHLRLDRASLSGARNLGLEFVSEELVGFPDDDCWYEPNLIDEVVKGFRQNTEWGVLLASWVEQEKALGTAAENPLDVQAWRRLRGGQASSICLFARADVFKQHGGFDERLGVGQWFGAGEETDWVLRTLCAGVVIGRWPGARIHHHFAQGPAQLSRKAWQSTVTRSRGTGALYAKHQLAIWVVLRGLLAPPVMALMRGRGLRAAVLACAQSWGRLQGALAWLLKR